MPPKRVLSLCPGGDLANKVDFSKGAALFGALVGRGEERIHAGVEKCDGKWRGQTKDWERFCLIKIG